MSNQAYIDITAANLYFQGRLNTSAWDNASIENKNRALIQSTRLIDTLSFAGTKVTANQPLQFPRQNEFLVFASGDLTNYVDETSVDPGTPSDIMDACCEIALALLSGYDPDMEARNASITDHSFSSVKTSRDTNNLQEWILAGIPSPTAWNLLRPYLRDPNSIELTRVT